MLPLEDTTYRGRPIPYVNISLVILNGLVFGYELALPLAAQIDLIYTWGLVPHALTAPADPTSREHLLALSTLFTSAFLHANLAHIAGNMLFLWVFGDDVEGALGHKTYLAFYLACGAVAGLSQVVATPQSDVPGIGASGAIAGVLASYLLLFPRSRVRALLLLGPFLSVGWIAGTALIAFWFIAQLVQSIVAFGGSDIATGGIAYAAHIGGFIAGSSLTIEIRTSRGQRVGSANPIQALLWSSFFRNWVLIALSFLALLGVGTLLIASRPELGFTLRRIAEIGATLIAIGDGLARSLGYRGLLGSGEGFSRLLALLQLILGLSLAFSLIA